MGKIDTLPALAAAITERMDELGYDNPRLARDADVSIKTVEKLVDGVPGYRRGTLIKIGRALRWRNGWYDRILDGDRPQPALEQLAGTTTPDRAESPIDEALRLARDAIQSAHLAGNIAAANQAKLDVLTAMVAEVLRLVQEQAAPTSQRPSGAAV